MILHLQVNKTQHSYRRSPGHASHYTPFQLVAQTLGAVRQSFPIQSEPLGQTLAVTDTISLYIAIVLENQGAAIFRERAHTIVQTSQANFFLRHFVIRLGSYLGVQLVE